MGEAAPATLELLKMNGHDMLELAVTPEGFAFLVFCLVVYWYANFGR